jgi:peptide/nickel transport system ATP-binding protein
MSAPILELDRLGKTFSADGHSVAALSDVSIAFERGECHAIVGESGSGKTTIANLVLGLLGATSGEIRFNGATIGRSRTRDQKRAIQLVQQNPLSALNPRRSVGASIRLPLDVHDLGRRGERNQRVASLLKEVGLEPEHARRSPRGLSGGQRQRIAIARALACEPELLVLDEPTSALDVLVQARVLDLLVELQERTGVSYLFITHDLAVVRRIAHRVAVLNGGRIVETGAVDDVLGDPQHPYSASLVDAARSLRGETTRGLRDVIAA